MKKLFLFFAIVLMQPVIAFANGSNDRHMGGWGHMMDCGYGGMFMWIIFLVVIGVVIYFIVQISQKKSADISSKGTPLDILKKRYAKGEITKEKFEKMREDLED